MLLSITNLFDIFFYCMVAYIQWKDFLLALSSFINENIVYDGGLNPVSYAELFIFTMKIACEAFTPITRRSPYAHVLSWKNLFREKNIWCFFSILVVCSGMGWGGIGLRVRDLEFNLTNKFNK